MFNNLANYLLGWTGQDEAEHVPRGTDVRLTAVAAVGDDDWLLVECGRDSEGDTDLGSSLDSIPDALQHQPPHHCPLAAATRTSSASSLPCVPIEESWFLTPPPCFTSAGPVHMETSPLENLLIEHPSMSVYQHSSQAAVAYSRRHNSAPSSPTPSLIDDVEDVDRRYNEALAERLVNRTGGAVVVQPNRGRADSLRQQERQGLKSKSAQKLQIHKACQSLKRGYIERNNKAREVNCRNHRQRRGERSQGSARSNANNNRKCC